jgi:hypothetical protein
MASPLAASPPIRVSAAVAFSLFGSLAACLIWVYCSEQPSLWNAVWMIGIPTVCSALMLRTWLGRLLVWLPCIMGGCAGVIAADLLTGFY